MHKSFKQWRPTSWRAPLGVRRINVFDREFAVRAYCIILAFEQTLGRGPDSLNLTKFLVFLSEKDLFPFVHLTIDHFGVHPQDEVVAIKNLAQNGLSLFGPLSKRASAIDLPRSTIDIIDRWAADLRIDIGFLVKVYREQVSWFSKQWGTSASFDTLGQKSLGDIYRAVDNKKSHLYHSDWRPTNSQNTTPPTPQPPLDVWIPGTPVNLRISLDTIRRLLGRWGGAEGLARRLIRDKKNLQGFQHRINHLNHDWPLNKNEMIHKPVIFVGHMLEPPVQGLGMNEAIFSELFQYHRPEHQVRIWLDLNGSYSILPHTLKEYELICVGYLTQCNRDPVVQCVGLFGIRPLPVIQGFS